MIVSVLLAGLEPGTVREQLQKLEQLRQGLPRETAYQLMRLGCEDCLGEISAWAAALPQADAALPPELTLVCATQEGRRLGMALAAAEGRDCHTGVLELCVRDGLVMARRKIYSTHLQALFPARGCVIIAAEEGEKADYVPRPEENTPISLLPELPSPALLLESTPLQIREDLSKARLVLLGGKGLGSRENFHRLEQLADRLGAACACTRPVALSGWAGYDKVTGISGWRLNAQVCIAFGVSGAAPLLAGLEGVTRVIAINNDPSAPIFQFAREGAVAECMDVIGEMEALLK